MSDAQNDPKAIFLGALDCKGGDELRRFLEEACGCDAALRARVEELLRAHQDAGAFLGGAEHLETTRDHFGAERPGTIIGPYKVLEQIGDGGFGVVFIAEQQQPVRRKVALKVLKPGMDTRQVVARFEAERQALALMDHPNIAQIYDGGTTNPSPKSETRNSKGESATPDVSDFGFGASNFDAGRPYFVMELVKGVAITDFCDQGRLTLHERLELFVHVCRAVQHAHHKGIIHRDIKPSNVLVTLHDGTPVPKVIDFGIAKAAGQQLTDKTLFTNVAQLIGTPLYMSPEQVALSGLDVDTRSDIYSLGVLLYELLTGTTPFDKERFRQAGYDEIRRIIREEEPPKPSARLSDSKDALESVSAQRHTEPAKLTKLVRGELDWIVMKALEKDRDRRYDTANAFAADVENFLQDEPVRACPPSTWYRTRKFARRNKRVLATTGLSLLFIASLLTLAGWVAWDRAARRQTNERGLSEALAQAETYLGEGDRQMDSPVRWQMVAALADGAAGRAEGLLATSGATAVLAERFRRVRDKVEEARRDSATLIELERIHLETAASKDGRFDLLCAAPQYEALLRGYGVDPAAPAAAAARVNGSRLREALLAALDEWRRGTSDAAKRLQMQAVQQAAEPAAGSFRSRWWAAAQQGDGAALAQLASEPAVLALSVLAILNLANDLVAAKQMAAAERLLRASQERYPANFWLNYDLGSVLLRQEPRRAEESVRYLTAALALRSDSPIVYSHLGGRPAPQSGPGGGQPRTPGGPQDRP